MRVKEAEVAAATGKRLLLMFDELFKGTNVKDAYNGTLVVTAAFAKIYRLSFHCFYPYHRGRGGIAGV